MASIEMGMFLLRRFPELQHTLRQRCLPAEFAWRCQTIFELIFKTSNSCAVQIQLLSNLHHLASYLCSKAFLQIALKMSNSLMNRILKQTMVTFSHNHSRGLVHLNNDQKFTQNVAEILRLTSCITSQDVFFEPHPVSFYCKGIKFILPSSSQKHFKTSVPS